MKRFIYKHILPLIGYIFIKLINSTYRIEVINPEIEKQIYARGERPIYCSWHQRLFPGITFFARRKPITIMVSQSKDGDFISRIIGMLGWKTVRGSSSKGGREALAGLIQNINSGSSAAHILDGPRGPFGEVKTGIIKLALETGMPILPTIITSKRKWIFKSWDRFIIPKPFTSVTFMFQQPVYILKKQGDIDFESKRSMLQEKFYELYSEADELYGS